MAKKRIAKKSTKNTEVEVVTTNETPVVTEEVVENTTTETVAKEDVKPELYVQYAGNEYTPDVIIDQIKEAWNNETDNAEITSMKLYFKVEEFCIYYVINDTYQGKIEL